MLAYRMVIHITRGWPRMPLKSAPYQGIQKFAKSSKHVVDNF